MKMNEGQTVIIPVERPMAVTVFGVMNCVFGGMGLVCMPIALFRLAEASEKMGASAPFKTWSLVIRIGFSIWLLILGIGLLKMSKWARRGSVIYAWVRSIWMIAVVGSNFAALSGWVAVPEEAMPRFLGGLCGGILGLIYPILLLIFMQRVKVKEAFGGDRGVNSFSIGDC
jgi:hypothetical protein